jgi:hypothetical protein
VNDRLSEIEERLRAFNVTGRSEEDDPVPHWKASDEFHGNSAPDIQWLLNEVERRDAEIARLRAAAKDLAQFNRLEIHYETKQFFCPHCWAEQSPEDYHLLEDIPFPHKEGCIMVEFWTGPAETPEEVDLYLRRSGYDPALLTERMRVWFGPALSEAMKRSQEGGE